VCDRYITISVYPINIISYSTKAYIFDITRSISSDNKNSSPIFSREETTIETSRIINKNTPDIPSESNSRYYINEQIEFYKKSKYQDKGL
jgi:hypothetical protein